MLKRLLLAGVLVIVGVADGAAQPATTQASIGGLVTTIVPAGGVFVDGARAVLRTTSVVGEAQVFGAVGPEFVAMGGMRQHLVASSQGDIYVQLLFGGAIGYPQRCDLCGPRVAEMGAGAHIVLNRQWALQIRGDIRGGGSAADLFYPTLGIGFTRRWR